MLPLRLVEKEHADFDEPIVELWRDNDFVGYVFWDDDVAVVKVYADRDGDPFDLGLADLVRALDMASQIVTPDLFGSDPELATLSSRLSDSVDGNGDGTWSDEDYRIVELTKEFDRLAIHRDMDGEGFFVRDQAEALIARCEGLDVAVVELEGLDWNGSKLTARPNMHLVVEAQTGAEWAAFRPQANATVAGTLEAWPSRDTLVYSFVVQVPTGDTRVL